MGEANSSRKVPVGRDSVGVCFGRAIGSLPEVPPLPIHPRLHLPKEN